MATKEKTARKDPWNDPALVGSGLTAKSIFDKLAAAAAQTPGTEKPDYSEFAKGLQEGQLALKPGGEWQTEVQPPVPLPAESVVPMTLTEEPRVNMTLTDAPPPGFAPTLATGLPKLEQGHGVGNTKFELTAGVPWQSTVKDNQPGWERGLRTATDPLRAQNIWQIPYRMAEKVNESTGINDAVSGFLSSVKPVLKDAADQFTMTVPEYKAQRTKLNQPAPTGKQSLEAMRPLLAAIAPGESGGRWDAQNPGSTAGGKYQILDQTWFGTIAKYGDKMGLPNVQASMYQDKNGKWKFRSAETELLAKQAKMNPVTGELGALYTAQTYHKGMTYALGREPSLQEFKFGWFAGVDAASKALKSDPNTPASAIFSPDAIKKNPTVFTAGGNTPVRLAISNYDNLGKTARRKGDGAPGVDLGAGMFLGSTTTPAPEAPPMRQPDKQVDYAALATLLEPLKPKGIDEALVKKQKRDLWIQGLLSGVQSREGGIPGMLARMAGGGFAGKAQGREYERSMTDKADAEMQRFQAQKIGLLSQGMQANVAGQNNRQDVDYANAVARTNYNNTLAAAAGVEITPGGFMKSTTRNRDGSFSTVFSTLAPMIAQMEAQARAGVGASGFANMPTEMKTSLQTYQANQGIPGGDQRNLLLLSKEIGDNPKAWEILGVDPKAVQRELTELQGGVDKKTPEVARTIVIYKILGDTARTNPTAFRALGQRVKQNGLLGQVLFEGGQ